MIIHIVAGYINLALEDSDFKYRNWKGFLQGLKDLIPVSTREWNLEEKLWHIEATEENQRHIKALRKLYFPDDPEQIAMF